MDGGRHGGPVRCPRRRPDRGGAERRVVAPIRADGTRGHRGDGHGQDADRVRGTLPVRGAGRDRVGVHDARRGVARSARRALRGRAGGRSADGGRRPVRRAGRSRPGRRLGTHHLSERRAGPTRRRLPRRRDGRRDHRVGGSGCDRATAVPPSAGALRRRGRMGGGGARARNGGGVDGVRSRLGARRLRRRDRRASRGVRLVHGVRRARRGRPRSVHGAMGANRGDAACWDLLWLAALWITRRPVSR